MSSQIRIRQKDIDLVFFSMIDIRRLALPPLGMFLLVILIQLVGIRSLAIGQTLSGDSMRWHPITITFDGPSISESSNYNPFLNYRMEVTFTHEETDRLFNVPGFFAADGNAGQTSASSGNKWRVHFLPDTTGKWHYQARIEKGNGVAVANRFGSGNTKFAGSFHGASGSFDIVASNKSSPDFRAPVRGLLCNRGSHYLTFASGKAWLKGGPDIPENFLGYHEFDNTPNAKHQFSSHASDWRSGDPTWKGSKGKNIIGALNYIATTGSNCIYFLPMNIGGDGEDTFPTISEQAKTRYDVSKLDQWDILFSHAQSLGIFLHFQLAETETANEEYHDGGSLGDQRKLYYRELIARFGHHPGLQWNLGEENDYTTQNRRDFAAYIKSVDPYDHPITTHTYTDVFSSYDSLLGNGDFDMTSFQTTHECDQLGKDIENWLQKSAQAGSPWIISIDEPQKIENDTSGQPFGYSSARKRFIWTTYLSGGGGFELYVQESGGGHSLDQRIEDFRIMDVGLRAIGHALTFMKQIPFSKMAHNDDLLRNEDKDFGGAQVLALEGEVYAIYLPDASNDDNRSTLGEIRPDVNGPPELDLRGYADKHFCIRWFNPRTGQFVGSKTKCLGGDWRSIGISPDGFRNTSDWALTVTAEKIPSKPASD